MNRATRWVGIGRWFGRFRHLVPDPLILNRRSWVLSVTATLGSSIFRATKSGAMAIPVEATAEPSDWPQLSITRPPLPRRALVRIGRDELRTTDSLPAMAFAPDGRLIAAADDRTPSPRIAIFDVRTGRLVKKLVAPGNQQGRISTVSFSPDGTKLHWGENGGLVALWELASVQMLFRAKVHHGPVSDVEFSPDGSLIASAGGDIIRLSRVARPSEVVRTFTTRGHTTPDPLDAAVPDHGVFEGIACMAFAPDGTRIVAGNYHTATLFVWAVSDGRLVRKIENEHGVAGANSNNPSLFCVAVTPDGRQIMSVGQTTTPFNSNLKYAARDVTMSEVRFWDIETGARLADYHGEDDVGFGYGALSRDGRRVAVADFGRLRILDAATGRTQRTIDLPGSWGEPPMFSPDGTLVAMPIINAIAVFEISTGRWRHHDDRTPFGYVESAAWSPSGDRIITGHSDGCVRIWDAGSAH